MSTHNPVASIPDSRLLSAVLYDLGQGRHFPIFEFKEITTVTLE